MRSPHPLLFHLPPLIPPTSFKLPHSHILTHTTDIRSHILKNNLSPPVVISDHRNKAISAYLQSYPARAQVYIAPAYPLSILPNLLRNLQTTRPETYAELPRNLYEIVARDPQLFEEKDKIRRGLLRDYANEQIAQGICVETKDLLADEESPLESASVTRFPSLVIEFEDLLTRHKDTSERFASEIGADFVQVPGAGGQRESGLWMMDSVLLESVIKTLDEWLIDQGL